MQVIEDEMFGGERPLFGLKEAELKNIQITDGESAVKCCKKIKAIQSKFYGKYPLWHIQEGVVESCYFAPASRSAIWYCKNLQMRDCVIDAPKFFREIEDLELHDMTFSDADETFWKVKNLKAFNLVLKGGTYPFMYCENVYVDGLESDSNYLFQYCRDVEVHHAKITTKDAFWECENVTVYDSELNGEYLSWHSKKIKLVRCHISGEQPLCYMENVTLDECTFDAACDRIFEDSSKINADIRGTITEIKNPVSGKIVADHVERVTYDQFAKGHSCVIQSRG